MVKNYNFNSDKDREQCARDFYKDIKMMAAKMSRIIGLPVDELELVCGESLVDSMNSFSDKKFIDKVLAENPDMDIETAQELANVKNDFGKWARYRMQVACQNFADNHGRIVKLPVNQIRANMKDSKNKYLSDGEYGQTACAYAGINDRLSLHSLIQNSHLELDGDENLGAGVVTTGDNDIITNELIDIDGDRGKDATDVLDELIAELKHRYGRERGADEQIDLYRDIVMNTLLKDTPDAVKKGDIAKAHGKSAAYVSGVQKKWGERSVDFFKSRGLM